MKRSESRPARQLSFFAIWAAAGVLTAATPHPRTLTLTSQKNGTEPQEFYPCSGTIHGYLVLPKTAVGRHTLEGIWTKPDGNAAYHSRNEVDFAPPGRSTAYVWFSFPERSFVPGSLDPAADEDQMTYAGLWRLDVRWDNQRLVQSTFTVRCPVTSSFN